jgi:hypothetical protein
MLAFYHGHYDRYFFFFGFFFFTPAFGVCVGIELEVPAGTGLAGSLLAGGNVSVVNVSVRCCRFCIFSMRDKFNASNRFRKIDEFVLNFMHYKPNL